MLTPNMMEDGAKAQENAENERQVSEFIQIRFFKQKKLGNHPSTRALRAGGGPEGSLVAEGDANNTEPANFYSPGTNFDRDAYEARDTGRQTERQLSYKSFLISRVNKQEALLPEVERASGDFSI